MKKIKKLNNKQLSYKNNVKELKPNIKNSAKTFKALLIKIKILQLN
jgi:hypothetical protein